MMRRSLVRWLGGFYCKGFATPNPDCLQFRCQREDFLPVGLTCDVPSVRYKNRHPIASGLFEQYEQELRSVFLAQKYVSVTKFTDVVWDEGLEQSVASFLTHFVSMNDVIPPDLDGVVITDDDTKCLPTDSEVMQCIKEILRERIRPMIQRDGGDLKLLGFDEQKGVVSLAMLGACANCPSSQNTLKDGIERTLKHWVPEVKQVVEVKDRELWEQFENVLFRDKKEVSRVYSGFEDARRAELEKLKARRHPTYASFDELSEPGED